MADGSDALAEVRACIARSASAHEHHGAGTAGPGEVRWREAELDAALGRLAAEMRRLREALAWYADPKRRASGSGAVRSGTKEGGTMAETLGLEDIERLERLDRAATPGPWSHGPDGLRGEWRRAWPIIVAAPSFRLHACVPEAGRADLELVAAIRNALPELLRLARAALAETEATDAR